MPNAASQQRHLTIPADFVNPQKLEIRLKTWFSNDIQCHWKGGLWLVESSQDLRPLDKVCVGIMELLHTALTYVQAEMAMLKL